MALANKKNDRRTGTFARPKYEEKRRPKVSAFFDKALAQTLRSSGLDEEAELNPTFVEKIKKIETAFAEIRKKIEDFQVRQSNPATRLKRGYPGPKIEKIAKNGLEKALKLSLASSFPHTTHLVAMTMLKDGVLDGYMFNRAILSLTKFAKDNAVVDNHLGKGNIQALRNGVKNEAPLIFKDYVPIKRGKRRVSKPIPLTKKKPKKQPLSEIADIDNSAGINLLDRLLLVVESGKNAQEVKLLIRDLADKIFVDAEMRTDFEQAAEMFLLDHLARANEQNPPAVPKKKFKPRTTPIVEFLKDVWGEWLDKNLLTKQILKAHDDKAYDALINWERNNSLSDHGLEIRSKSEDNDKFLSRTYFTKEEAYRVVGALNRRQ